MSDPREDESLQIIRQAATGDAAAMELFLLQHRDNVLRYLNRHVPDELRRVIEPQDVLQDVCFDAFRRLHTFKADDAGMALRWLLRIARNRITDLVRMQHAAKRGGGQAGLSGGQGEDEEIIQILQGLAVYERTPSQSAQVHELVGAMERCLQRLPKDYRQAIRHRYLDGLTIEEISQRMNRSSGAVMMLCNRGLKALRQEMRSFSRYL